MPTAAILGCAGYTGQETLDRVLAHPELEPIALGSDSLAGPPGVDARSAPERRPAAVRDERRGARGRRGCDFRLPRPRGGRGARAAGRRARHRSLRRAPPARRDAVSRVVRLRAPAPGRVELRPAGALPAGAAARRESRLLRDGDAACARAARRCDRPGERRGRREVGCVGSRPRAEGVVARRLRSREPDALPRRHAPARARDRAGARLSRLLRPAPAAGAPRPARHVLRAAAGRPARLLEPRTRPRRPCASSTRA